MESRQEYVKQLQHQLDEWVAQIDLLRQEVLRVDDASLQSDLNQRIEDLHKKCQSAQSKINQFHASQHSGWHDFKDGADQMWKGIKDLFKDTTTAFHEGARQAHKP